MYWVMFPKRLILGDSSKWFLLSFSLDGFLYFFFVLFLVAGLFSTLLLFSLHLDGSVSFLFLLVASY
jgi:hypothetical protein